MGSEWTILGWSRHREYGSVYELGARIGREGPEGC